MKSKILILIFLVIGFTACNNNQSDPEFNYDKILSNSSNDTTKEKSLTTLPGLNTQINNQTTILPAATNSNVSTTINPAHGLPGHRCDIPVGAPLNSNPLPVSNQNQTLAVTPPTTSKSNTANKGLNPVHGQPGHRCDIPVGAPLNSKPVAATQQNQPGAGNKNQPVVINTPTAPGMNPPHGQPGHRCDIAVGTPLNQPITKKDTNTKTVSPLVNDSIGK